MAALAAFAWIQTESGKRQLARAIGQAASDETMTVEIANIDGFLPFDLRVGDVALSDGAGVWLRAEEVALDWSPAALLFGRVEVDALTLRRLAVDRLPAGSDEPSSGGMPSLPVAIRIAHVKAAEIMLAEPVLGAPARLSLDGMAELADPDRGFRLVADIRRTDATSGELTAVLGFEPESRQLRAEIAAAEPEGGVLARLLDLPGLPAMSLSLFGEGTIENWSAQLALDAGPELDADAEIAIVSVGDAYLVTFDAEAALSGLLSGAGRELLAGRSTLVGRALIDGAGVAMLDRVSVQTAGGTARSSGRLVWSERTLDLGVSLEAAEPAVFADLLPGVSWGRAEADFRVLGDFASPRVEAVVAIDGFSSGSAAVTAIAADVFAESGDDDRIRLWGEGSLTGVSLGDAGLDALLSQGVQWQISGDVGFDGSVSADQVRATTRGIVATATGTLESDGGGSAQGRISVDDLEPFQALATLPVAGRAELDWRARSSGGGIAGSAEVRFEALRIGIPEIDALIAEVTDLAAGFTVGGDGAVEIDGIQARSGGTVFSGRVVQAQDRVTADWDLAIASLAPLSDVLGVAMDGQVTGIGRIEGPLDDLALQAEIAAGSGIYDGVALPDVTAVVDLADLAGDPSGTIRLAGDLEGLPAQLETGLEVLGDGGVRFAPIAADFAGWAVTGEIDLTASGLATGRLQGHSDDLAALAGLLDTPLSGGADFVADIAAVDGRQDIRATVELATPAFGDVAAAVATAELGVEDLTGEPRLNGQASATGLATGAAVLDRVDVDANGGLDALRLSLAVADDELSGEALGDVSRTGEETRIDLARFRAVYRDEAFVLSRPATIVIAPDAISVEGLAVEAGQGRAALAGSLGETLDLSMDLTRLPLSLLALAGPGLPVSGHIDGTARLSGPIALPEGTFELRSDDLRSDLAEVTDLPPARLRANGRWTGGRLALDVTSGLEDGAGIEISAELPLRLSPDGFAPVVDGAGGLSAEVRGTLDVSMFDNLLAAAGNRVEGEVSLDLRASGTIASPVITGTAALSGGRYENAFYGSRLDEIAAKLSASNSELRLTELSAVTPGGGTLAGAGFLTLDPQKGFPFQIDTSLRNGAVVETPLASATADADLRLSGALTQSVRLAGEVSILTAEFRVPDRLPVSVPDLPVEEVNLPADLAARRAASRPSGPEAAVDAELDVVASARQAIFVRGRGLDVELGGDLTIRGSAAAPAIGGDLTLRNGTLDILGRRLTFQRGGLGFDGSSDLDPEIDLQAGADVSDATVSVEVGGRVSAPEITLSSTPELPQDEIAARLLFGKDVRSLTPFEAVSLAQSVGQLSGLTGSSAGLLDQVRQSIGLDRLDVGVDGESGQTSVSGGSYVADGVYVGMEQGLDEQSSRVNVEIEVTPNVKVESDVGADAQGRIGVNLEWDY